MSRQEHIEKLITIHEKRLQELEKTKAFQGISVDPKVPLEINEIQEEIDGLHRELEILKQGLNPFTEKGMQKLQEVQITTQTSMVSISWPTGEVEIRIKGSPSNFTSDQKSNLLQMLALSLECPVEAINILAIRNGSTIVKVEMPQEAIKKLIELYEDDDKVIQELEIQDVSPLDSAMIGKIEKAILYSQEPERITFENFEVTFKGDHKSYKIKYDKGKWDCSCTFFQARRVCSHIMTLERILIGSVEPAEAEILGEED